MSEPEHAPNILQIHIEEPTSNPEQVSPHHALANDLTEAEKRYRALTQVVISQLTGLQNTHLRIIVSPAIPEALEAVTFWLLPLFRGNITKNGDYFLFTPEQHAPAFSIEFTTVENACTAHYEKVATLSAYCPDCSSRWINAAMIQCAKGTQVEGKDYLNIQPSINDEEVTTLNLPELPIIKTAEDWEMAIDPESPTPSLIGPKLNKLYQET